VLNATPAVRNRSVGNDQVYDAIAVSEMPNDEAVARVALANASMGNIRSETSRAFTEDEYRKIIATLP